MGDYVLGKSIGEGTFGKVKVGTHRPTGQKVAIKVLKKSRILDNADVERVSREIHILKTVQHPHIIQLYEIIETPKTLYLIMEYVSGGELFDYIVQNQRVDELQACKFFQQIISGVEYFSQLRIVHRDLKPENMLLDYDNSLKLVDFGLSNTYKTEELLKTACGSPCYAAPEMIAGKRYNGTKVDIWSCGVILFALLCGFLPFEDQNTSALYKKILNADYQLPDHVSQEASDLLAQILTTDPEKRITIKEIKNHDWYHCVEDTLPAEPGTLVGVDPPAIDQQILGNVAKKLGMSEKAVSLNLEANKHNRVTTTYFLMLKKHLKEGGKSIADARQVTFNKDIFKKKHQNPNQS